MTIAVDLGRKATKQTNKQTNKQKLSLTTNMNFYYTFTQSATIVSCLYHIFLILCGCKCSMSLLHDVAVVGLQGLIVASPAGPGVIKLDYSIKLKIKRNDWLIADICPQAANHCALFCY